MYKYKDFGRLKMVNWVPLLHNCLHNRLNYRLDLRGLIITIIYLELRLFGLWVITNSYLTKLFQSGVIG